MNTNAPPDSAVGPTIGKPHNHPAGIKSDNRRLNYDPWLSETSGLWPSCCHIYPTPHLVLLDSRYS